MPNFRGNKDLCKLGKEYLNDLLCKFGPFCLQHFKTFDISHAFLWATVAELSTLTQVRFFGPPCISDCIYAYSLLEIASFPDRKADAGLRINGYGGTVGLL